MNISITSRLHENKEYYEWELKDGPDDFESVKGYSTDLINAFTKILEWRERILKDYEIS